jgi:hypothetical protein
MEGEYENLRDLFGAPSQADHAAEREREDRKANKRARVHTIRDLLHVETEQADPLLGPLVRRGQTTIIGGYGGAGKSTMAMEMVRAIVTGNEFLGWEGEGHTALVIDLEQGVSIAQRRVYEAFTGEPVRQHDLTDLVADMDFPELWDRVIYADWQEGADLFEAGPDIELVDELLTEHKPDVVLIDPIYKLFMGRDMNEQVEISNFVREIQKLRTKHGFALLLPMHPRKMGQLAGNLSMQDLYGSMIWSAWAENIVMVQREEGNLTKLRWEKDRQGESPAVKGEKWTLTFEPGRGFRRDSSEADKRGPKLSERIWEFLQAPGRRGEWFTNKELAHYLGLGEDPQRTVAKATLRMEKRKAQDGTRYPGLRADHDRSGGNLYTYMPDEHEDLIEKFKRDLDATEEW